MQSNAIRVPEEDILELYARAKGYSAAATSARKDDKSKTAAASAAFVYTSPSLASSGGSTSTGRGLEKALSTEGSPILSPERHAVLFSVIRGMAVGEAVGEVFCDAHGYIDLAQRKKEGRLVGADEDRFSSLVRAKALVSIFSAASFVQSKLPPAAVGDEASGDMDFDISTTSSALSGLAGVICDAVEGVPDDKLDEVVSRSVSKVMSWAEQQSHRMMGGYREDFEGRAYAVEKDGFSVRGFQRQASTAKKSSTDMQFRAPSEVVGNHVAKSQAMRLAKMLASYDFDARENPFVRLGGFTFTIMGDGYPGTGKTTLIQMVCGLIKDLCDVGGYPYHFENFGVDQISEYQGKSGQNARAFVDRVLDPRTISFGTVDDIDQVAGKRDDSRSSGGQQEVTAVLMDAFAGAATVVRGNCSFGMFSNYPDKVDDALRQRAGARWLVDGPQTLADYTDIFHLLIGKNHKIALGDHDLFAAQAIKAMAEKSYAQHARPQEADLVKVFESVVERHGEPKTVADIGRYLYAIHEREPRFTGRAIKNITDAVKNRSMDVDLPDEWFAAPEAFMRKPFEEKCSMLEELRRPITMEMVMQEINRYADSEFRYTAKSDEAAIEAGIKDHRIRQKIVQRIQGNS